MHFFQIAFLLLGPLCAALAYTTLVKPLCLPRRWRCGLFCTLLAFSLKFTWYALFGRNMFLPELPECAIHILSVIYDFVLISAVAGIACSAFTSLAALLRLCWRRERTATRENCAEQPSSKTCSRRRFVSGAFALGAAGVAAKGVHDGRRLPDVVEVSIQFLDLPPSFDGYRIVQLSDLHVSAAARADRTAGVVRMANALKPDLIAITGDFVDGPAHLRANDVFPLAGLRAADGVFGCTGNHEYYSGYALWHPIFRDCGIQMLENDTHTIRRGSDAIAVIGQNDPVSFDTDIHAACAGAPAFRILLAHRPTRLAEHAALGIRLQLSGHTHGGAVLGLDRLVARANEGHVRGLYRENGTTLYVNSGTGQWAGFPTRIGVLPEITSITLQTAQRTPCEKRQIAPART